MKPFTSDKILTIFDMATTTPEDGTKEDAREFMEITVSQELAIARLNEHLVYAHCTLGEACPRCKQLGELMDSVNEELDVLCSKLEDKIATKMPNLATELKN